MNKPSRLLRTCALVCAIALTARSQPSQSEIEKMQAAAPGTATTKAQQSRKLLVFNRFEGYQHSAIRYASKALEILGRKTGAFEVTQSDDMAMFAPERLQQFDAVCFNNCTGLNFEDPKHRQGLLDFIAGGKGVVGIHAATDNFRTWPEAAELFGGQFEDHPWTAEGTWAVRIEDPNHPLNAAFQGKDFLIRDEIYRIRQLNLRKNCRVLLGLDMKNERNRNAGGVRYSDRDMPISWVRTYGKGRLFYCSIGHNEEIYWNPTILRHYLDGIQFALGDYPAETAPVPFDPMSFFNQDSLTSLLRSLSSYRYGDSRAVIADLNEFIRGMDDIPEARLRMESQFAGFLRGDATLDAKQFICQKLALLGTEQSVPVLSEMLKDQSTVEMALFALESLPSATVDQVLLREIGTAKGKTQSAIVNALGNRRTENAVPALRGLLAGPDPELAAAAAAALGSIGSAPALAALKETAAGSSEPLRQTIQEYRLAAADRMRGAGNVGPALDVYRELNSSSETLPIRRAALRGLVLADPTNAEMLLRATIQSSEPGLQTAAIQLLAEIPDIVTVRNLVALFPTLPPAGQVQMLGAIARREDPLVQATAFAGLKSKHPEVRLAASQALASCGDGSAVRVLSAVAAGAKGEEQNVARKSLAWLQAADVDDSVVALLSTTKGPQKLELLRCAGERRVAGAVPLLMANAKSPATDLRRESARALKLIAPADSLSGLLNLLVTEKSEAVRSDLELATVAAARALPDSTKRDEAIVATFSGTTSKPARLSLIKSMGKIAGPNSIPPLRNALHDKDADIRLACIRALSEWPSTEPYGDLWGVATSSKEPNHRVLALRGSVRLLGLDTARSVDETLGLYREAMNTAPNAQERRLLLSEAGQARSVAALRFAAGYLEDRSLNQEAEVAVLAIAEGIMRQEGREVVPPLETLMRVSSNEERVKRARELIAWVINNSEGVVR